MAAATLRLATPQDSAPIDALMKSSIADLFPSFYDARVLDPATEPARVRAMFVRGDRTRQGIGTRILEACEAAARAEGYRTLALMATLPGIPLYARFGFVETGRTEIRLPDGVMLECAS